MRLPDSQFVTLLLVAGLSSVATLTLCIAYIHTAGLPDLAGGVPPSALSPTASTRAPRALQGKPVFIEEKDEIVPVKDTRSHKFHNWCYEADGDLPITSRILRFAECEFGRLVFTFLKNKVAVVISILVGLGWHFSHWYAPLKKLNPLLRNLSTGVLVLNIFYNSQALPSIFSNNPFMLSCVLMVAESSLNKSIETNIHKRIKAAHESGDYRSIGGEHVHKKLRKKYTRSMDDDALKKLKIVNRYQKLTLTLTSTIVLFLAQTTLGLFYVFSLNNVENWQDVSGWRWFIALCLCNLAGEEEVGSEFQLAFWLKLRDHKELSDKWTVVFGCVPCKYALEIDARMVMSAIVNLFLRRIIFCTAPVLLGVAEEPMDFIQDCLAVFFITKLDDFDDAEQFDEVLEDVLDEESGATDFKGLIFDKDENNEAAEDLGLAAPENNEAGEEAQDGYATKGELERKYKELVRKIEALRRAGAEDRAA